jgi:hypothetical protein
LVYFLLEDRGALHGGSGGFRGSLAALRLYSLKSSDYSIF